MTAAAGRFVLRCPVCGWRSQYKAKTLGVALFGLRRHSCEKKLRADRKLPR